MRAVLTYIYIENTLYWGDGTDCFTALAQPLRGRIYVLTPKVRPSFTARPLLSRRGHHDIQCASRALDDKRVGIKTLFVIKICRKASLLTLNQGYVRNPQTFMFQSFVSFS